MKKPFRIEINYLYFGFFFLVLMLTSSSGIFLKQNLIGSRFFFFLYATVQAILEMGLFVFLGALIERFFGKKSFSIFIGVTFLFFFIHIADFLMDRILDLSIWGTLGWVSDESLENFFFLLDASGIPFWGWGLIFGVIVCLPFLGFCLYRWTEKMTQFRPLFLKRELFLQGFFCMPLALLFWDYSASKVIHPDTYTAFLQSLPWKFTFLSPETVSIERSNPLKKLKSEENFQAFLAADKTVLKKKPNIYIFVVESLRKDAISSEITPHLFHFQQETLQPEKTFSNANGTHLSWFSIFHSEFSFDWKRRQEEGGKMGSLPLQLLKKWGYKIRLYTSAQLSYYGMEEFLFGKDRNLLASYQTFHHVFPVTAADTDAKNLAALKHDLKNPDLQQGQVFIVFWDATHFDYSWPKDWTPKFSSYAKEFAYFKAYYSEEKIQLIRNRYLNSVHYIDHLFGQFLQDLPLKEEAIIAFMGDHGEEFFERGCLFHNSHLVEEQMNVPILLKLGERGPEKLAARLSHMDVFPTLLHHVSGQEISFFEGQSAFSLKRWPFTAISRFNAGRTPYEFCLHSGRYKLILQFADRQNIFSSKNLLIRSVRDERDRPVTSKAQDIMEWVDKEFGAGLDRLF